MTTCHTCGRAGTDLPLTPPLTWTLQITEIGRRQWLCDVCTRANVRSIEARLDESWWSG